MFRLGICMNEERVTNIQTKRFLYTSAGLHRRFDAEKFNLCRAYGETLTGAFHCVILHKTGKLVFKNLLK